MKGLAPLAASLAGGAALFAAVGVPAPGAPLPSVPPGFRIEIFAAGLGAPRTLAVDASGTLVTSISAEGRIVALPDRRGRGAADDVVTVARNLQLPHGLAFHRGSLYVAETGRVLRFRWDPVALIAREPVVVVDGLPAGAHHWTRTIAFGPDGRLYVAIGSSCEICREADARRAAIVRYDADGSRERVVARGLRNPVGLAFDPTTGAPWTTVNERDWRAGDAPPDFVTSITEGANYGWPDCYAQGGLVRKDPQFRGDDDCGGVTTPTLELPPHSAPLGLVFYAGGPFPAAPGALFVALHGSRAGLPRAGYRIARVTATTGRPAAIDDFSVWWHRDAGVIGRPVDLVVGRDGALYVSDDHAGRIYRTVFVGNSPRS